MHLSLDLFGTLIKSNPKYKEKRVKIFQETIKYRYGLNISYDECFKTIRLAEQMFDDFQQTSGEQETIYNAIECILHMFLTLEGRDDLNTVKLPHVVGIYNELEKIWFMYPPELYDGCEEMLNYFADEGLTFNVLSNTTLVCGVIIDKWLQHFRFYKNITFSLYSDIIGVCKPSAQLFEIIKNRVPEDIKLYHVGDNEITDGACINSDILFVHVNNKDENKTTVKLLTELYAQ